MGVWPDAVRRHLKSLNGSAYPLLMKTAIPINTEVVDIEVEKVIKKFREAVSKKRLGDATVIIEDGLLMFRAEEGEIRLFIAGINQYLEIRTRSCTVSSTVNNEFSLTRPGVVKTAPKLVVDRDTYTVDELITLLRKGFRELLLLAASDL